MPTLDAIISEKIALIEKKQQKRSLVESLRHDGVFITRGGKRLISFSCNDYYGLSQHPEVIAASIEATRLYGAGAGASRLVSGNHPLYSKLEALLAKEKNCENALVAGSGYLANIGAIPTLVGRNDLIIADKYIHACMIDAAKLSAATLLRFAHNNIAHLRLLLAENRSQHQNCLIATESVFSMDGDSAPLAEIIEIAKEFDCWIITDNAHELLSKSRESRVESREPRLTTHDSRITNHVIIGTLSKSLGSYGGYICGSKLLIEYLQNAARSIVYSTALPPSTIAAAIKSIQLLQENEELRAMPLENAQYFTSLLELQNAQSAIVPVIIGESENTLKAAQYLTEKGFYVAAIRPPTVPENSARLRFTFSALHNKEQIENLAENVREVRRKFAKTEVL